MRGARLVNDWSVMAKSFTSRARGTPIHDLDAVLEVSTLHPPMINIKSLKHAIVLQEKIEVLKAELRRTLGSSLSVSTELPKRRGRPSKVTGIEAVSEVAKPKRKKRKMSPEALEKIRAAQKKRWAAFHKAQKANA